MRHCHRQFEKNKNNSNKTTTKLVANTQGLFFIRVSKLYKKKEHTYTRINAKGECCGTNFFLGQQKKCVGCNVEMLH